MSNPQQSLQLDGRPLPEPEATVWRILSCHHRGRANAISMSELARLAGLSTRAVQSAVEYLISEHRKPLGSSCGKPSGYYVIVDQADLELTFHNRVSRGIANFRAAYALKKSPEVAAALGQVSMIAGGEK